MQQFTQDYISPRDRDAWATLRGYVYQIDTTILRWLHLPAGHALELEAGEDIDLAFPALTASSTDRQRLLEQVKHREESLTLRRKEALAAIANFHEHRDANPALTLRFRFTTNARIGRESVSPVPNRVAAISAWECFRTGQWDAPRRQPELAGIRLLISDASCPQGITEERWRTTSRFFRDAPDDQLLAFLRAFEWSAQSDGADDLMPAIQARLVAHHGVTSEPTTAKRVYEHLFFYVFTLLTHRRDAAHPKCLTPELLRQEVQAPEAAPGDASVRQALAAALDQLRAVSLAIAHLQGGIGALDKRVSTIETALDQQAVSTDDRFLALQDAILRQLNTLAQEAFVLAAPDPARSGPLGLAAIPPPPVLDAPPPVAPRALRPGIVQQVTAIATRTTWTALSGSAGIGKTQLALLVAESLSTAHDLRRAARRSNRTPAPSQIAWLSLRDRTSEEAIFLLDSACQQLAGGTTAPPAQLPSGGPTNWYRAAAAALGPGGVLVVDDLPRVESSSQLSSRVIALVRAFHASGGRLLSTSGHPLPSSLCAVLQKSHCVEYTAPNMDDQETADLLREHGAPDTILQANFVAFLRRCAQGNLTLLTAIARHLVDRAWRVTQQDIETLLAGQFAADVNEETLQRLLNTIPDTDARDLVYRLTLARRSLSFDDVRALAGAQPTISRPRERLQALDGLWVQRDNQQQFFVSPLLKALGASDLTTDTRRECHRILATRLVEQSSITPVEAIDAIFHFADAEDFDRAGGFLAFALHEVRHAGSEVADQGLLGLWTTDPLPAGMSLGVRIHLRGAQIAARQPRGLSISQLCSDLDQLLSQAGSDEAWAVISVTATTLHAVSAEQTTRYARHAMRLLPEGRLRDGRLLASLSTAEVLHTVGDEQTTGRGGQSTHSDRMSETAQQTVGFENLIWLMLPASPTPEALSDWLAVVESLPLTQRQRAFLDPIAERGALLITEGIWQHELARPAAERQWMVVAEALADVAGRAQAAQLDLLWACAERARIIVYARYLDNLPEATAIANAAQRYALTQVSSQPSSDGRLLVLIQEAIGSAYLLAGRRDAALQLLEGATQATTTAFPRLRVAAWIWTARATWEQDRAGVVPAAQQAAAIARDAGALSPLDVTRFIGELAIATWYSGDWAAAFDAFDEAADRLLACRPPDDAGGEAVAEWRDVCVVLGHAASYCAIRSALPQTVASLVPDDRDQEPIPGMLLSPRTDHAVLYTHALLPYFASVLTMFAEGVSNDTRAAVWAKRGVVWARDTRQWLPYTRMGTSLLVPLMLAEEYADALETAYEVSRFSVALRIAEQQDMSSSPAGVIISQPSQRGKKQNPTAQRSSPTRGSDADGAIDRVPAELDVERLLGSPASDDRRAAEEVALELGLLPLGFRLALLSLDDPLRAQTAAKEVSSLCRHRSLDAANPALWVRASERVLGLSDGAQPSMADLADLVVEADQAQRDPSLGVRQLSHLGLALRSPTPTFALRMHNLLVEDLSPQPPGFYSKLVVPFLASFWRERLTSMSAQFHQPDAALRQIGQIEQIERATTLEDVRHQIRRILNSVQAALW